MKRVFSILFALALVLSFSMVVTTPVAAATLYVPGGYATIQAAVNAANPAGGDTIIVAAGTYDEQVVINKSLTLQGAGDTTIIRPSSALTLGTILTGLRFDCSTKNIAGIIVADVATGSPVTIKNLKVDESLVATKPAGADYLTGIFYRETGGLVDTVTVAGTGAWSGGDRAYGMYLSAGTNAVSVEVKGSSISNWDKNGIEVMGSTLTANIHNNILTGRASVTDECQNGVNVGCSATATVNDNTISDLEFTSQQWWSFGIIFSGANLGSANGNSIIDCQGGIVFDNNSGSAQGNTIDGGSAALLGLWAQYYAPGLWTVSFVDNGVCAAMDDGFYSFHNAAIGVQNWDPGAIVTAGIHGNQLTAKAATTADGILIGDPLGTPPAPSTIVATITQNTISAWQHGIRLEPGADDLNSKANLNDISGNTVFGVANLVALANFDATSNWWGDPLGPGPVGPGFIGDRVTPMVNFMPFLPGPCVPQRSVIPITGGTAYFVSSDGNVVDLTAVAAPTPPPVTLPYGMFEFKICCMTGSTATLSITLPGPVPVGTKWWKYHNNTWSSLPISSDNGDNFITVTLRDNVLPDDEDTTPGQITDQGAPGYPGAVGWETYPVSKVRVLLPWIGLLAAIMAGVSLLVVRRRRAQS
jgi:K+-transporting ATPase c subunit